VNREAPINSVAGARYGCSAQLDLERLDENSFKDDDDAVVEVFRRRRLPLLELPPVREEVFTLAYLRSEYKLRHNREHAAPGENQ